MFDTTPYSKPDATPCVTTNTTPLKLKTKQKLKPKILSTKLKIMKKKHTGKYLKNIFAVKIHLAEDLFNTNQIKNNQIVNHAIDSIN